ncbi:MAG: GrpB family protein [Phycisphaerales bacterium]|nr:GrpB family protein [Phycisphaerales bacterium]
MNDGYQVEAMMGIEPGQITLVPHDPAWSELAEAELTRIHEACPERIIEWAHIGSTAIPNLSARPVLDLLVGVEEMMHSGDTIQPLKSIGYRCHGEQGVPGRRFFSFSREGRALVHVHLYRVGSPLWQSAIATHEQLLANAELAQEYDELRKRALESDPGDLAGYEQAKRDFEQARLG